MPSAWAFPAVWSTFYIVMGFALAIILNARGASNRSVAILLFTIQLALNLAWLPTFFLLHRIMLAFGLLLACLLWTGATTVVFWNIRWSAGVMMMPYLAWLAFAGMLNWQVHELNPKGLIVLPAHSDTQIVIE
jgi:tryptophan-rich sensory protein